MNKNRGLIIAVVFLFLFGTITFAFADTEEYSVKKDGEGSSNVNGSNSSLDKENEKDESFDNGMNSEGDAFGSGDHLSDDMLQNIGLGGSTNNNTNLSHDVYQPNDSNSTLNNDGSVNNGGNGETSTPGNNQNGSGNTGSSSGGNDSSNSGGNGNTGSDSGTTNPGGNGGAGSDENNSGTTNPGDNGNPGDNNGSNTEQPTYPPFEFIPKGTFSTEMIYITDPNYSWMTVYNSNSQEKVTVETNLYKIPTKDIVYYFTVHYKDGTVQSFRMNHKSNS